jgi:hypothetical protein
LRRYLEGGQERFAGVWRAGTDAHYHLAGVDRETITRKTYELEQSGLRLVDFNAYG